MSQRNAHVEPLDWAILDFLCKVPTTWQKIKWDDYTSTQQEAIKLMTAAGLIEQRMWVELTHDRLRQVARMLVSITGEPYRDQILKALFDRLPGWVNAAGRTTGEITFRIDDFDQIRLTHDGECGRDWYLNPDPDNPSEVVAFVCKRGIYQIRVGVALKVLVDDCIITSMDAAPKAASSSSGTASMSAQANASVGDIVINNNIDFSGLERVVNKVLNNGQIASPQESPPTQSEPPNPVSPTTDVRSGSRRNMQDKSGKPKKATMTAREANKRAEDILAREGWPGDLRSLATKVGCSHETLRKCPSVQPHLKRGPTPKRANGRDAIPEPVSTEEDPLERLAYEEEFQAIYDQAKPAERVKLDAKSPEEQRTLVDLRRKQLQEEMEDNRHGHQNRRGKV